jgi:hypothetical protein
VTVYLASPSHQMQAASVESMPVLLSFALWKPWLERYVSSFGRLLLDSGAYSAHTIGTEVDVAEFAEFAERFRSVADAVASLDSISGDWRQGWRNMEAMPDGLGFPTFHDSDPPELLDDLISAGRERGGWIGVGLIPETRHTRGRWLEETLDQIPPDLHVHGWACRRFWRTHRRLDSVDSTNWILDGRKVLDACPWLTPAEATEIVVKRYRRERRTLPSIETPNLFAGEIK